MASRGVRCNELPVMATSSCTGPFARCVAARGPRQGAAWMPLTGFAPAAAHGSYCSGASGCGWCRHIGPVTPAATATRRSLAAGSPRRFRGRPCLHRLWKDALWPRYSPPICTAGCAHVRCPPVPVVGGATASRRITLHPNQRMRGGRCRVHSAVAIYRHHTEGTCGCPVPRIQRAAGTSNPRPSATTAQCGRSSRGAVERAAMRTLTMMNGRPYSSNASDMAGRCVLTFAIERTRKGRRCGGSEKSAGNNECSCLSCRRHFNTKRRRRAARRCVVWSRC